MGVEHLKYWRRIVERLEPAPREAALNEKDERADSQILQKDPVVDSMRSALTKRSLDMLEKLRKKDKEAYLMVMKLKYEQDRKLKQQKMQ